MKITLGPVLTFVGGPLHEEALKHDSTPPVVYAVEHQEPAPLTLSSQLLQMFTGPALHEYQRVGETFGRYVYEHTGTVDTAPAHLVLAHLDPHR